MPIGPEWGGGLDELSHWYYDNALTLSYRKTRVTLGLLSFGMA